jgi:hypothetical protein
MSNSIFKIDQKLNDLYNKIEENEGEITPELKEELEIGEQELEYKFRGYSSFIRKLVGDTKLIDDEMSRLKKLKDVKLNTIKSLEKTVLLFLQKYGNKVKAGQGFKYQLDFGDLKIENKYTNPLIVTDDFEKDILYILRNKIYGEELPPHIESFKDLFEELLSNVDEYVRNNINIKVENIDSLRSIHVFLESEIDFDFSNYKIEADKLSIKKAIKDGKIIPNTYIDNNEQKLVIK